MAADPDPASPALLEPVGGAPPEAGDERSVGPLGPLASRSDAPLGPLALGAAVGAVAMVLTSNGDALLLGVLLGVAASDLAAGAVGVLTGLAVLGRWGSTSLAALAGGQAVIGPSGWTGSTVLVVSAWCAAAALVLAVPRAPASSPGSVGPLGPLASRSVGPLGPLAFGLAGAAVIAGPSAAGRSTASTVGLRVGASIVLIGLAWVCSRAVPRGVARPVAVGLAGVSAITAAL